MSGGIYQIRCTATDTIYVGSAKDFDSRWGKHLFNLRRNSHVNPHLQRSFQKYGESNFIFEILEELGSYNKEAYFEHENFYIEKALATGNCFNIAKAEGGWTHHTFKRKEEISNKISDSLKRYSASLSDDERRQKFGVRKGSQVSKELRAQISKKLKGIKKSDDVRQRMSEAQKKIPIEKRQEAGRRVGLTNIGRPASTRKRVAVNDIIFDCLKDAATFLNSSSAALCRALKENRKTFKSYNVRYCDD